MSFFRLNDAYALRSFTDRKPLVVLFGNPSGKWEVSADEMALLQKCDGTTDINVNALTEKETEFLKKMIGKKAVSEVNEPLPIKPNRAYREYHHKRIAVANWALTVRCNMNCLHCLNLSGSLTDHEPEITLEEAGTIIRKLADYGVEAIEMFGGEPTVYGHFMEVVRMIYEAGMQINSIDTNGMLINDRMLDEFDRIGASPIFAISFDGLGTHEWMRNRKGCEETVKKAIRLCVDRGFRTNIGININKRTLPVLEKTIDYFKEMGCKRFKLLRTSESFRWVRTEAELGEQLTISTSDFAAIMVDLIRKYLPDIRAGLTFTVFNTVTIRPHSTGKSILNEITTPPEHTSGWCPVGENGVFIGYKGHIAPCPGVESLLQVHGLYTDEINLLKRDLEEIVYGDFYRERFRITRADIYNTSEECRKCSRWKECNGGICRMNATIAPECLAAGAPPEKVFFSNKDVVSCSLMKEGYLDRIAAILDGREET